MESARCSGTGSGNSGTYATEMTETFRFEEEIQSLMRDNNLVSQGFECSPTETHGRSSFTALLGLHPTQAMELLHELDPKSVQFSLGCSRTFPSDAALMERATRFSIFAATQDSPEGSSAFPCNSDDNNNLSTNPNKPDPPDSSDLKPQRTTKRKESEKTSKAKNQSKKGKSFSGDEDGCSPATIDGEKLPYVHVRARRGQATDSHSLAERARREKINARMKLLQELVPGCSKISGTALVLDEIINHVQLLQRQVEILSMRLAAVNPRIDFTSLDSILSTEQCGRVTAPGHGLGWTDGTSNAVIRRRHHLVHQHHPHLHQIWTVDLQRHQQQQQEEWERDEAQQQQHVFMSGCGSGSPPGTSLFGYDSVTSVPLSNQLKSEM